MKVTYNEPRVSANRIPIKTVSTNDFNRLPRPEIKSHLKSDNYLHINSSHLLRSKKNFLTTKQFNKLQSKKETIDATYNQSTDRQEVKMKIQVKLNQLKEDKPQKVFKYLEVNRNNNNKNDTSNISDSFQESKEVKEKKNKNEYSKFHINHEESDFESVLSDNSIKHNKNLKTNKAQLVVDSNNEEDKKHMRNFINGLSNFFPCPTCREDFKQELRKVRLDNNVLSTKENLIKFACIQHNSVNSKLGKEVVNCDNVSKLINEYKF